MAEQPPAQMSIAARIAALRLHEVGRQPGGSPPVYEQTNTTTKRRSPPPLPVKRPESNIRHNSVQLPVAGVAAGRCDIGNQPGSDPANSSIPPTAPQPQGLPTRRTNGNTTAPPSLPSRRPTDRSAPQLPPRRPSESPSLKSPSLPPRQKSSHSLSRRESNESVASTSSAGSRYAVRAPAFDPSNLPPLPPKRQPEAVRATLDRTVSSPLVISADDKRRSTGANSTPVSPAYSTDHGRKNQEPHPPSRSALTMGFGDIKPKPPILPVRRPDLVPATNDNPPPVPSASRPDLEKLKASKPRVDAKSQTTAAPNQTTCLKCRDFSHVDAHAACFPRQSIPSTDLAWLSHNLTSFFPSPTDKARAIFTWLHHNIDYDVGAFFSGNIRPSTPASTIGTGLAVCEGYAGLFAALATTAGLEAVVIGGHGKGFGHTPLGAGKPLPPFAANHAWNAVRIDNNEWKLVEPCWGAGHIQAAGLPYVRRFSPACFTMDNIEFGTRHYPSDRKSFFRADGRAVGWEEYLIGDNGGEGPLVFGGFMGEEGISELSFLPAGKRVSLTDQRAKPFVRFQFRKVCEHWDPERNGKGRFYCYVIIVGGRDGKQERKVPFETNGLFWWVDVLPEELGVPGQKIKIAAINSFDGRDGRGLSAAEFREKDGRVGMGWGYVAEWDLVA